MSLVFSLTSKDTASVPRWNTDSKQLRWCRVHGRAAGERGALGLSITPQPGLPCLPLIRPRGISFVSPVATPALPGGTPAHASVGLETREPSRTPLHWPTATLPSACGPGAQAPCRQHPLQALRITAWPPGSRLGPPGHLPWGRSPSSVPLIPPHGQCHPVCLGCTQASTPRGPSRGHLLPSLRLCWKPRGPGAEGPRPAPRCAPQGSAPPHPRGARGRALSQASPGGKGQQFTQQTTDVTPATVARTLAS